MDWIEFESTVQATGGNEISHMIPVPNEIADPFREEGTTRMIAVFNEVHTHPCALIYRKAGYYFIRVSKKLLKQLELAAGDPVAVRIRPDTSEYGMPLPESMKELLELDDEGKAKFDQLTPGRQRNIIHYVSQAQNVDIQIERAITILDNLKANVKDPRDWTKKRNSRWGN